MNADEIDILINQIESLQLNLNNTREQLNLVRTRVGLDNPAAPNAQPEEEEEGADRPLRVGDRVEILNPVRLRGSIRSSRNVQGTISRFTQGDYVIIRVRLRSQRNSDVETYQEIRRARHNVGRIIETQNRQ